MYTSNLGYYYIITLLRILREDMKMLGVLHYWALHKWCIVPPHAVQCMRVTHVAMLAHRTSKQHSSSPRSHINSIKTSALSFEVINGSSSWFYSFASMHPLVF